MTASDMVETPVVLVGWECGGAAVALWVRYSPLPPGERANGRGRDVQAQGRLARGRTLGEIFPSPTWGEGLGVRAGCSGTRPASQSCTRVRALSPSPSPQEGEGSPHYRSENRLPSATSFSSSAAGFH